MEDFARMFDGPTVGKRESGERALWLVLANGLPGAAQLADQPIRVFVFLTSTTGNFADHA